MQERRREKRIAINYPITVEDEYVGEQVGMVVDISPGGLRIRGKVPIAVDDDLKLCLHLPKRILGKKTIRATVVCVWSRKDEESDEWLSGHEFYQVSQKDSSLILGVILEEGG